MANINLAESGYQKNKPSSYYINGLITISVILAILIVGYLWIFFSEKSIEAKIASADSQYNAEYATLMSANKDVVDFQDRIITAKNLIDQESSGYNILPATEQSMVPGAYLESFSYDQEKNTLAVEGIADNFDVLAKQILSFKRSDYFSGVTAGATSLNKDGKVDFSLNMNIK